MHQLLYASTSYSSVALELVRESHMPHYRPRTSFGRPRLIDIKRVQPVNRSVVEDFVRVEEPPGEALYFRMLRHLLVL